MSRSAGVLALLLGLGFGILGVIGVRHFARQHEIWQFLGFPTYGDGPFERAGILTTVPLLLGFVAVCAAEVGIGVLLAPVAPRRQAHPSPLHHIGPPEQHVNRAAALCSVTLGPDLGLPQRMIPFATSRSASLDTCRPTGSRA